MKKKKVVKNLKKATKKLTGHKPKLEELVFPSYQELISGIEKKVGKRPTLPRDLPKGEWTEQSLRVLSERYLLKDDAGRIIETPEEMCWRVSWNIASAEANWGKGKAGVVKSAEEFYRLLVSREFLPNSPTLMNAGTANGLQYSACFVLPVEDSLVGIFDAIKYQALIHQTGGGTGFSFSRLRPRGSVVKSSKGTASGPVSFMRIFDAATNEIKQGGKRRGANMGILRVDHPDILEFIHAKEEGGITNFNISVAITDKFMEAYEKGVDYELINPKTKQVVGKLDARHVFNEIAQGAWRTGDPGIVFIDKINRGSANPVPFLGPIESTNPCGEQPLYPYDSCNLGSIFLNRFVKDTDGKGNIPAGSSRYEADRQVDWEKLRRVARTVTRFMDDVIEMNPYPLESIRKTSLAIRRIGIGVGGWADMLISLGIAYDSEEAVALGGKIMKTIQEETLKASEDLARERGPFPLWPVSIYRKGKPRRNSTVTTIAPTGSISIIAGASSGIEPIFALAFQHVVKDKTLDRTLTFINPVFEEIAKDLNFWSEDLKKKLVEHGVIRNFIEVPGKVRAIFGTAHEIHHDWHIKHQAAFQKYTENAVSKTINMRNETSEEDVKRAYLLAWKIGCKGITVFRDGCKKAQVLNTGIKDGLGGEKSSRDPTLNRPFIVSGSTYRVHTPVGNAFITINQDESEEPLELFVNVGKAGSDVTAMAEALGRTISTALRFKSDLKPTARAKEIALQLAGIGGRRSVGFGPNKVLSLPDAVAMALSIHFGFGINGFLKNSNTKVNGKIETLAKENGAVADDSLNGTLVKEGPPIVDGFNSDHNSLKEETIVNQLTLGDIKTVGDICPSCGASALIYQEGCSKCQVCGHSEC
jgi:ribonucleoside-diphosphate reductase alpha chain